MQYPKVCSPPKKKNMKRSPFFHEFRPRPLSTFPTHEAENQDCEAMGRGERTSPQALDGEELQRGPNQLQSGNSISYMLSRFLGGLFVVLLCFFL